jgi:hypothetical protein
MRIAPRRGICLLILTLALANISGPANALEGRWKLADDGTCYLDQNDSGPNQCSPSPGRWKLGADQFCYWDDDDSGPNQCVPPPYPVK